MKRDEGEVEEQDKMGNSLLQCFRFDQVVKYGGE